MRKVVFLTTIPSPYRVAFFNEWGKLCDLTVIFEKQSSSERSELWKNVDVRHFTPVYLKGISVRANKAFAPSITTYLKKLKYDVFIIGGYNTPTAMLAAEWLRAHKIPYILNADGGYIKKDNAVVNNVKRRYISGASTWICTSDKTIDYFKYYGADEKKVFKYPFTSIYEKNVLSEPLYPTEKKEIRARLGIPEEKMIISVGQFIYRKGFDVLLEACKELGGDTGIYLIGGKATDEYAEIVKNNRIQNVHFLDFMSPVELAEYYKAADLFAFPTREDIWGLVVNEAAAYGLPIVTTFDCIAGLEMVSDANGKLVPANDTIALKTAIVSVLSDSDNAYKMAKASLAKAKAFTVEKMAKRHDEIIEEFIDERKKSKKEK